MASNRNRKDGISRRDFLNGMLLAAGGVAVGGFSPMRAFAAAPPTFCGGPLANDPRALRGGNLPSVFDVGHWLRDQRLTWSANQVVLAPSGFGCDPYAGTFPILDDGGTQHVIIVGAGMSGVSAAYFLRRNRPGTRILILDGQPFPGGNAARDDAPPIPAISSTATAYAVVPYNDFLNDIYDTTGIDWQNHLVADPFYSYFFDDRNPYALPGVRSWNIDTYGKGLKDTPYPAHIVQDLQMAKQDLRNWYVRHGAPTDPADDSDPRFDYLSPMTFSHYLTSVRGFHPAVADFYDRYAVDALTGLCSQVSAYTSISFIAAEYNPEFAYPGGNSGMLRKIVKWLVPGGIAGDAITGAFDLAALDAPGSEVRIRQTAMVLRGDTGDSSASVIYYKDGNFHRATAAAVIFAGQTHTAKDSVIHLLGADQLAAMKQVTLAPVIVANVALRRAAPVVDLGYDAYYWGSQYWADFVIADWVGASRNDPERPTVLTFYGGNTEPPEHMPQERLKLITTTFDAYEQSLRDDLGRVLADRDFDFDRDVTAIYLYRWGHAMVYPKPGWPHGTPINKGGQVIRTPSPREIARQAIGRIHYGAQDVESSPANESAIGAGYRTAHEVLAATLPTHPTRAREARAHPKRSRSFSTV